MTSRKRHLQLRRQRHRRENSCGCRPATEAEMRWVLGFLGRLFPEGWRPPTVSADDHIYLASNRPLSAYERLDTLHMNWPGA